MSTADVIDAAQSSKVIETTVNESELWANNAGAQHSGGRSFSKADEFVEGSMNVSLLLLLSD